MKVIHAHSRTSDRYQGGIFFGFFTTPPYFKSWNLRESREIQCDLESAKRDIFGREGKSTAFDAVSRSHANLLRMWAEVAS